MPDAFRLGTTGWIGCALDAPGDVENLPQRSVNLLKYQFKLTPGGIPAYTIRAAAV